MKLTIRQAILRTLDVHPMDYSMTRKDLFDAVYNKRGRTDRGAFDRVIRQLASSGEIAVEKNRVSVLSHAA